MQYLFPVGFGPSSKTCPKCAPDLASTISTRGIKGMDRSTFSTTWSEAKGAKKECQPVSLSNFALEAKRGKPPTALTYTPSALLSCGKPFVVSPVKERSVAPFCFTHKKQKQKQKQKKKKKKKKDEMR